MRQEHQGQKTFVVSALIGHLVGSPWPFGRLEICDEAITVRTIFRERTCPKSEITDISLERLGPQNQLLFEDTAGKMADVAVVLAMRVKGVVGELRRRGTPWRTAGGQFFHFRRASFPGVNRTWQRATSRLEAKRQRRPAGRDHHVEHHRRIHADECARGGASATALS